jgi:predicted lipoprotein with Yx(FWY)xxD motif
MRKKMLAPAGLAAAALVISACGSSTTTGNSGGSGGSGTSPPAASGSALKTANVNGTMVLANAKGLTLYSFAPDTPTTSKCNGSCAGIWPPVKGPASAGTGVTGKLTTITRSDGAKQASYNGHPLYTYTGDTSAGQANGNGLNINGGVWHVVSASGGAAPAPTKTGGSGGGGY